MAHVTTNSKQPRRAVIQTMVHNYLLGGGMYSAADISTALHLSDPRGHIRTLRNKGVAISDEWRKSEHGSRYKVYFIH